MRKICLALSLSAVLAMPSRAETQQEFFQEVQADSGVSVPVAPGSSPPTSGQFVFHFRADSQGTATGTLPQPGSGARVQALYLTFAFCVVSVTMQHRPIDSLFFTSATFGPSGIITFPYQGLLVEGPWVGLATYFPSCGTPAFEVTVTWNIPAPVQAPPANAVVQGFKLDGNGNRFNNATIFVDGNSTGSGNPYAGSMSPNINHHISSSVPAGYSVAFSACTNCINHPDSSWVFANEYVGQSTAGGYLDLWWKYYAPPNSYLDTKQSYDGAFGGWAYDPSASSTSIAVHVYVDGPAGSGAAGYAILADGSRPDVDAAFGISGNHGFTFVLPSQYLQDGKNHTIYAYAISLFHQPNPLIGTGTYTAPLICSPGFSVCGSKCVNLDSDSLNCGGCGIRCGLYNACIFGSCECVSRSCP